MPLILSAKSPLLFEIIIYSQILRIRTWAPFGGMGHDSIHLSRRFLVILKPKYAANSTLSWVLKIGCVYQNYVSKRGKINFI